MKAVRLSPVVEISLLNAECVKYACLAVLSRQISTDCPHLSELGVQLLPWRPTWWFGVGSPSGMEVLKVTVFGLRQKR